MGEDTDMAELMQNRDFLESVLSTLPGVNPEEALLNLEQMSQASQEQQAKEKDEKEDRDKDQVIVCLLSLVSRFYIGSVLCQELCLLWRCLSFSIPL